MLHDTGLSHPPGTADFTLASARLARDVADESGCPPPPRTRSETAITMHHSPGVGVDAGPVAYLCQQVRRSTSSGSCLGPARRHLADAVPLYPRADFKRSSPQPSARKPPGPRGPARFLYSYGAFAAAIKFAPFDE